MSRFFRWMIHPVFLTILGLVSLSLVIWFGANYVKFGDPAEPLSNMGRAIVILVVWFLALLIVVIKLLGQRKQNDTMVEAIQEESGPTIIDEENQVITDRFKEAMSLLRTARFEGKQGRRSIYQLPWYIIIGPPGAGKTTALVNSGLHFPLKEKLGVQQIGGIGGTRNCDWWFTDEAVIIDTAGRYTTQDSDSAQDKAAWGNFLNLLKQHRTRRPVNGIILAMSIQDLLSSSEAERQQHAEKIRNRIQELCEQFKVKFPIYLLFTKADLISGFNEFYEDLGTSDREQVWGITFPFAENQTTAQTTEYFLPEFDALVRRLNERVIWRAHRERDLQRRGRILGFPSQVENLRSVLDGFIKSVFTTSRFEQQTLLRGVYFTSGTQEGRPFDRILANLSSNYGINYDVAAVPPGSGKSFFINHLLRGIIFPEAELASVNVKYENRVKWIRRSVFIAMGLFFALAVGAWTTSIFNSQSLMQEVQASLNDHKTQVVNFPEPKTFEQVLAILEPLQEARARYEETEHPWLSSMGLYDNGVVNKTDQAFDSALRHFFKPFIQHQIETVLGTEANNDVLYDATRTYLMLGDEKIRQKPEVMAWYADYWAEQYPGQAAEQEQLKGYLNHVLDEKYTNIALKNSLLNRSRDKLRTIPIEKRIYKQIKRQPEYAGIYDLTNELGVDMRGFYTIDSKGARALRIPVLFTKSGYQSLDLSPDSDIVRKYSSEQWILGDDLQEDFSDKDIEKIVERIKMLYFSDYIQTWSNALDAPVVKKVGSMNQARDKLALAYDRTDSPVIALINQASKETLLTPRLPKANLSGRVGNAIESAVEVVAERREPTPVDEHFRELHKLTEDKDLERYLDKLRAVFTKLEEISLAPNAGEAAFNYSKGRFAGAGGDPIRDLRVISSRAPSYVKRWMESLADESWKVVLYGAKGYLSNAWNRDVYTPYKETLARGFPFASNTTNDAALPDFAEFFKPGGIEDQFVKANIRPFINSKWQQKAVDRRAIGLSENAIKQLRQAESIRNVFFSKGEEPSISFQIRPEKLDNTVRRFDFEVGDQRLRYTHGPRLRTTMEWPTLETGARILFEDLNGTMHEQEFTGDWGFFRLLDANQVKRGGSSRQFQVNLAVEFRKAELQIVASSASNPFYPGWIKAYRCPDKL